MAILICDSKDCALCISLSYYHNEGYKHAVSDSATQTKQQNSKFQKYNYRITPSKALPVVADLNQIRKDG